jgi:hypothetical protein
VTQGPAGLHQRLEVFRTGTGIEEGESMSHAPDNRMCWRPTTVYNCRVYADSRSDIVFRQPVGLEAKPSSDIDQAANAHYARINLFGVEMQCYIQVSARLAACDTSSDAWLHFRDGQGCLSLAVTVRLGKHGPGRRHT